MCKPLLSAETRLQPGFVLLLRQFGWRLYMMAVVLPVAFRVATFRFLLERLSSWYTIAIRFQKTHQRIKYLVGCLNNAKLKCFWRSSDCSSLFWDGKVCFASHVCHDWRHKRSWSQFFLLKVYQRAFCVNKISQRAGPGSLWYRLYVSGSPSPVNDAINDMLNAALRLVVGLRKMSSNVSSTSFNMSSLTSTLTAALAYFIKPLSCGGYSWQSRRLLVVQTSQFHACFPSALQYSLDQSIYSTRLPTRGQ